MRIGINCYLLEPHIGGIKQYFLALCRELLLHDDQNQYVLFYFDRNISELEKLGTDLIARHGILLREQGEIRQHLHRIDLYFCPFGSLIPRPLPLPTVVTIVDIQEVFFPEFFTVGNLVARFWHYVGSTRMADHVLTISAFSKDTLVHHHGLPPAKITVAHLCADERFYRARDIARRPAAPLPEKFIFYPANRWRHKNHDMLLRALAWLRDHENMTVHGVFTGFDQDNGYPLEEKAKEYGIADQVTQLGYVSVEELAYLYGHAELLVFPSLFEGFGIPLVEAMAAGCPVLAARATSLPEVGGDGAAYFDPASPESLARALGELLADPAGRRDLVALGRRRAGDFSPAAMGEAHKLAFRKAALAYSGKRYLWLRYGYKYLHVAKTLLRAARVLLARI
ncbi:MAG: glycosyltransferase family 4 protein [Desulfobulbaceae bacterium]